MNTEQLFWGMVHVMGGQAGRKEFVKFAVEHARELISDSPELNERMREMSDYVRSLERPREDA